MYADSPMDNCFVELVDIMKINSLMGKVNTSLPEMNIGLAADQRRYSSRLKLAVKVSDQTMKQQVPRLKNEDTSDERYILCQQLLLLAKKKLGIKIKNGSTKSVLSNSKSATEKNLPTRRSTRNRKKSDSEYRAINYPEVVKIKDKFLMQVDLIRKKKSGKKEQKNAAIENRATNSYNKAKWPSAKQQAVGNDWEQSRICLDKNPEAQKDSLEISRRFSTRKKTSQETANKKKLPLSSQNWSETTSHYAVKRKDEKQKVVPNVEPTVASCKKSKSPASKQKSYGENLGEDSILNQKYMLKDCSVLLKCGIANRFSASTSKNNIQDIAEFEYAELPGPARKQSKKTSVSASAPIRDHPMTCAGTGGEVSSPITCHDHAQTDQSSAEVNKVQKETVHKQRPNEGGRKSSSHLIMKLNSTDRLQEQIPAGENQRLNEGNKIFKDINADKVNHPASKRKCESISNANKAKLQKLVPFRGKIAVVSLERLVLENKCDKDEMESQNVIRVDAAVDSADETKQKKMSNNKKKKIMKSQSISNAKLEDKTRKRKCESLPNANKAKLQKLLPFRGEIAVVSLERLVPENKYDKHEMESQNVIRVDAGSIKDSADGTKQKKMSKNKKKKIMKSQSISDAKLQDKTTKREYESISNANKAKLQKLLPFRGKIAVVSLDRLVPMTTKRKQEPARLSKKNQPVANKSVKRNKNIKKRKKRRRKLMETRGDTMAAKSKYLKILKENRDVINMSAGSRKVAADGTKLKKIWKKMGKMMERKSLSISTASMVKLQKQISCRGEGRLAALGTANTTAMKIEQRYTNLSEKNLLVAQQSAKRYKKKRKKRSRKVMNWEMEKRRKFAADVTEKKKVFKNKLKNEEKKKK